ncbi:MAG: MBL fold metallo-hydrolase [Defluviitaleaceae bacterium]|nr:MBL fold metallo-hydrolase [Defluviitaleaceae bacterium]
MKILTMQVGSGGTNCYIAYDEKSLKGFIVDPGDDAIAIMAEIGNRNIEVEGIFVTHGHYDHIAAVNRLRDSLEVPSYCSELDAEVCASDHLNCSVAGARKSIVCVIDKYLSDGEVVDFGWVKITALLLPGHTHGQMAYYIPEHGVVFTGDNLFKDAYGRYDLPTANFEQLKASLNRLFTLPADTQALPGHGRSTTIGHEAKNNPILRKH